MIPPGPLYGLLAALGWGTMDFLVAHTGSRIGERTVFAVSQPVGVVLLLAVVPGRGESLAPLFTAAIFFVGLLGAFALLAL